MAYLKLATYQEREKEWRERAANAKPGPDQDACLALADGYRDLIKFIERVDGGTGKG